MTIDVKLRYDKGRRRKDNRSRNRMLVILVSKLNTINNSQKSQGTPPNHAYGRDISRCVTCVTLKDG